MKTAKCLITVAAAFMLAGCSNLITIESIEIGQPQMQWFGYYETDKDKSEISFTDKKRKGSFVGIADVRVAKEGSMAFHTKLSDVYTMLNKRVIVGNTDTLQVINLDDKAQMNTLKSAKKIKIYIINPNFIDITRYSSPNGVCNAFNKNQAVSAASIVNRYRLDDKSQFFVDFLDSNFFAKKEAQIKKSSVKFEITDKQALNKIKSYVKSDEFKQAQRSNLAEQKEVLSAICR